MNAYTIWEIGSRDNQEDSIFPTHGKASDDDRLFVLCDGMGGHSAGEVASQTVCNAISASMLYHCPDAEGDFTDENFRAVLDDAFDLLDLQDDGAAKKMGTTMAFLKFHTKGCTIAHIGDSRVYHIRPGKGVEDTEILFQTRDHSLINDLIQVGELTPEEAKHSRQKNVITRAMQPHMERRPKADVYHTSDIRPGDYFMLCSDGMLEQMEDDNLRYIFSDKGGDAPNKVDMLIKVTAHNNDNHSAIVVRVNDVIDPVVANAPTEQPAAKKQEFLQATVEDGEEKSVARREQSPAQKRPPHRGSLRWIVAGAIIVLAVLGGYAAYKGWFAKKGADTEQTPSRQRPPRPQDFHGTPPRHSEGRTERPQLPDDFPTPPDGMDPRDFPSPPENMEQGDFPPPPEGVKPGDLPDGAPPVPHSGKVDIPIPEGERIPPSDEQRANDQLNPRK